MRKPLLDHQPEIDEVSLSVLIGLANAIERESVQRYDALADFMQRRGDAATAEAFRAMRDEERAHVDAVEHWAGALGEAVPDTADFSWRLPPEMANAWNDVAGSARLSPYRAYAIAADNEQRAFALYSYLAAQASDPAVAAQAERLALEELRHASLMRRWRRKAWHRERRQWQPPPPTVATQEALDALLAQQEAGIAERHRAVAAALRAQGDEESARLLEDELAGTPVLSAVREAAPPEGAIHGAPIVPLLVSAQEPLEALSETLEVVMRSSEGALFSAAETALVRVVRRLARLALQIERRMRV
jgi:rubrerythrin